MLKLVDDFLNRTTMYRLVLYLLIAFAFFACVFSVFGLLPYPLLGLLASLGIIVGICVLVDVFWSRIFKVTRNVESVYITAFILFFIIPPFMAPGFHEFLPFAILVSILAISSKYLLVYRKKHIFNPAAIGLVLGLIFLRMSGSWWIGTPYILPVVLLGGLLMVRKVKRWDLFLSFLIASTLGLAITAIIYKTGIFENIWGTYIASAYFFFAIIMVEEPLSTPPTRPLRILYGAIVGILFTPALHVGNIYSTPELALVLGNIFSFLVSPKGKLLLRLKEKREIARDTFGFIFSGANNFNFTPGQYMEWTLGHARPDARGNRRYFTLASSPTEPDIHLGVKFYPKASSFKKKMMALVPGEEIAAGSLAGDFTLPPKAKKELVWLAGGIGITPFRSMTQYLLDKKEKRPITLLYSNKTPAEVAYREIFARAESELGMKIVYVMTETEGFIDAQKLKKEVPGFMNKIFYVSGPHGMVDAFTHTLKNMGVHRRNIKIDFFPGYV